MSQACFSNIRVAGQMGIHHSVILSSYAAFIETTGMVVERPRSDKPTKLHLEGIG